MKPIVYRLLMLAVAGAIYGVMDGLGVGGDATYSEIRGLLDGLLVGGAFIRRPGDRAR